MDDKKKKLKKMATWTMAIFATIFAVTIVVLWLPLYNAGAGALGAIGQAFAAGWPVLLVDLVLCAGVYFGYKFLLDKKK